MPFSSAFAMASGYGEAGGSVVTKRKSASAGSSNADAFVREAEASVDKSCSENGAGRGEVSVGGIGVRRNLWITFAMRPGLVTIAFAMSFVCCAKR